MKPLTALTRTEVDSAITAAIAAPSVLNTQPWRFTIGADTIDIFTEPGRALPATDPDGRAVLISCGAALLNLRLALANLGRDVQVTLLPDARDTTHVARVDIAGEAKASAEEVALYRQIPQRRTSRNPFQEGSVAPEVANDLVRVAGEEGCLLHFLSDWGRSDILTLLAEADLVQRDDPAARAEISRWVDVPAGQGAGIPARALGPRPSTSSSAVRDFDMSGTVKRPSVDFEAVPTLAVLHTRKDQPRDWVVAGQALERVLLAISGHGLAASLSTQPVEVRGHQWLLRDPSIGDWVPHILIRVGYGPRGTPTPRLPLTEVVTYQAS